MDPLLPPTSAEGRYGIAVARFHDDVTSALLDGARAAFAQAGVEPDRLEVVEVPGAFELPFACRLLSGRLGVEAVVALGCVVRGETPHFDFVAGECCRGIMELNLHGPVPVVLGVLTTETKAQALHRASREALCDSAAVKRADGPPGASNKGWEAARTALAMAALRTPASGGSR